MTPVAPTRPEWEVADVIRDYGEAFRSRHGGRLVGAQMQALRDLGRCRTAALGGHVERCLDCGRERIAYNSCRNRHCPKCQATTRARWLEGVRYVVTVAWGVMVDGWWFESGDQRLRRVAASRVRANGWIRGLVRRARWRASRPALPMGPWYDREYG